MERIFEQVNIVTNPFNEKMMLESFKSQLSSTIFKEVINDEKYGLKVTFTVDVIESEKEI